MLISRVFTENRHLCHPIRFPPTYNDAEFHVPGELLVEQRGTPRSFNLIVGESWRGLYHIKEKRATLSNTNKG